MFMLSLILHNISQIGYNKTSIGFVPHTGNSFNVSVSFRFVRPTPESFMFPELQANP